MIISKELYSQNIDLLVESVTSPAVAQLKRTCVYFMHICNIQPYQQLETKADTTKMEW